MLIGADRLFASSSAEEIEKSFPSSPKQKGEGHGLFESLLCNSLIPQEDELSEGQKTQSVEEIETVASQLSILMTVASKDGRLKIPSFATTIANQEGTMVASSAELATEDASQVASPEVLDGLKAEDITSSQLDELLNSILGPLSNTVLEAAGMSFAPDGSLCDTVPIEPQLTQPLGDTVPIEPQLIQPLGDTAPIEPQLTQPLGDTVPIEPQLTQPLGDTVPIEPERNGFSLRSEVNADTPESPIDELWGGTASLITDGQDNSSPITIDGLKLEEPSAKLTEAERRLIQEVPLHPVSLNGQNDDHVVKEGASGKVVEARIFAEKGLASGDPGVIIPSSPVVEEVASRLKASSTRTLESKGYSLKSELASLSEGSVESKNDTFAPEKESFKPQSPAKETPVFLSSWMPEKGEGKFQAVTEGSDDKSEDKPDVGFQRGADQGTDNLMGYGETRQSVQPRSEPPTPTQTVYLPQKGPDALPYGLAQVVRQVMTDGTQKATVIIDPPALGRVEVEVRATSTGIEASFKVDSAQVRDMIKPQIPLLQDMLSQNGIVASSISVDIRQGDERRSPWRDSLDSIKLRRRKGAVDEEDVEVTSMEIARIDMERGVLQWYA